MTTRSIDLDQLRLPTLFGEQVVSTSFNLGGTIVHAPDQPGRAYRRHQRKRFIVDAECETIEVKGPEGEAVWASKWKATLVYELDDDDADELMANYSTRRQEEIDALLGAPQIDGFGGPEDEDA